MSSSGGGISSYLGGKGAVIVAAVLAAAGAVAIPVVSGGGGGGGDVANVWAIAGSPGTGCARSGTQVAYNAATDCSLAAACTAASGGDVVKLQTGNYGEWAGCAKSSPGVTFTGASGVTPQMRLSFGYGASSWLILDGVKLGGGQSDICGGSNHITITNSEVSDYMTVSHNDGFRCSSSAAFNNSAITLGPNIDFTLADWDGDNEPDPWLSGAAQEGRLAIMASGADGSTPTGILITGATFEGHADGTPSCADGIFYNTGGWTIEDSRFRYLWQSSCSPHVDGSQAFAGAGGTYRNVTFNDNYFSDSASGIVDYDSHGISTHVTNNVFDNIPGLDPESGDRFDPCAAICAKGTASEVVTHNTLRNSFIQVGTNSNCDVPDGAVVRDNILGAPVDTSDHATPSCGGSTTPTNFTQDHNFCLSGTCTGTGSLNSTPTPTWVGGANPSTFAGWALAGSSRGENAASDGTDIGVNP